MGVLRRPQRIAAGAGAQGGSRLTTEPDADRPVLPAGRPITLPAGTMSVRDLAGPDGAPTIVLLHGWTGSADVNFYRCYEPLAERFRVLAYDLRGHGTGIRAVRPFRLADCADDVAALADHLGIDAIIPIGYSLGGAVAQLVAQRHRDVTRGIVLCSTAAGFRGQPIGRRQYYGLVGLAAVARVAPPGARRRLTDRTFMQRKHEEWDAWALDVAASHDWRMVLEAGAALGTFDSSRWIGNVGVPASVVVTEFDEVVPAARQHELADRLDDVAVFTVDAGHDAAVSAPDLFTPALIAAIDSVVERAA